MKVQRDFYIGFRMVDQDLSLKNEELLNLFIDIAGIHSSAVGDGLNSTYRWLLIGYTVKIHQKPKYGDIVNLITWSRNYTQALAFREFEVRNEVGELLICAVASFVRYDIIDKKLTKITPSLMETYESENKSNFAGLPPKKLCEPSSYLGGVEEFADWKWLDLNAHVNNSYYLCLAERVLSLNLGIDVTKMSFDVWFKREIYQDTPLKCLYFEDEEHVGVSIKSEDEKTLHGIVVFNKL